MTYLWIALASAAGTLLALVFFLAAGRLNRLADRARDEHEEGHT